jgi:hypothetical protein
MPTSGHPWSDQLRAEVLLHRVNIPRNRACRTGEANRTIDELHSYQLTWLVL